MRGRRLDEFDIKVIAPDLPAKKATNLIEERHRLWAAFCDAYEEYDVLMSLKTVPASSEGKDRIFTGGLERDALESRLKDIQAQWETLRESWRAYCQSSGDPWKQNEN